VAIHFAKIFMGSTPTYAVAVVVFSLGLGILARCQEPPHPAEPVAEAARNVREHQSNSTKHPKIFTDDDLRGQYPVPSTSASPAESPAASVAEVPKPPSAECDNPDADRLKVDLLAGQAEQDQVRRAVSYNPLAISGGDVDMKNFKPGSSGVSFGGPPLLETKPPAPVRIEEVSLDEKMASLTRALRIACDSPKDAGIQKELDGAEQELKVMQREFDLDQNAYYSKTNYAADTAGKAKIDAEAQQVQYLQSEVDRLKGKLSASKANQILN
jgi:outer membrane murein-binding lipoprotein Lpp